MIGYQSIPAAKYSKKVECSVLAAVSRLFASSTLPTKCFLFYTGKIEECIPCPRDFLDNGLRPTRETFDKYLTFFLNDLPDENCAKAGRAAYANVCWLCDDVMSEFKLSLHNIDIFFRV